MRIGVYHPRGPLKVVPGRRIRALVKEAQSQGLELLFFDEEGIDPERRTIDGVVPDQQGWKPVTRSLPDVVINELPPPPSRRGERENALRAIVPFTSYRIGGKKSVGNRMLKSPLFGDFIVPTVILRSIDTIDEMLARYPKLVLKPDGSSRGRGVHSLAKADGQYRLQRKFALLDLDREELAAELANMCKEHAVFLIQPYIVCLTGFGEPFDFRVHVQRNGEGSWSLTRMYPRIGPVGTITSNIAQGGRSEEIGSFVRREFPDVRTDILDYLHRLGVQLAEELSTYYPYRLDELGLDIAIDADRNVWMYEANTSPQTKYHHDLRAAGSIAYARFVARANERAEAPFRGPAAGGTVGLLLEGVPPPLFLDSCSQTAEACGCTLAYFLPDEVRTDRKSVQAHVYRDGRWLREEIPFPDVVHDLLRKRGESEFQAVYAALSDVAFTGSLSERNITRADLFAAGLARPAARDAVPEHLMVRSAGDALNFLQRHPDAVLNPDRLSGPDSALLVHRRDTTYEVIDSHYIHRMNETDFARFATLAASQGLMLQPWIEAKLKEGYPYSIQVLLMKDGKRQWSIASILPLIGFAPGAYRWNRLEGPPPFTKWDLFLTRELGRETGKAFDHTVKNKAIALAEAFDGHWNGRMCECRIHFAVSADGTLQLIDAGIHWPDPLYYEAHVPQRIVAYAASLLHPTLADSTS